MANTIKNAKIVSVTTGGDTLYTCPAATAAIVHAVYLSNIDGTNDVTATVEMVDASPAGTVILSKDILVAAGKVVIFDKQINLEALDLLKITASANADLSAFASIVEIS